MTENVAHDEARVLLRFAARSLSEIERRAAEGLADGITMREIASPELGGRGAIYYAQKRAIKKMRRELERLGVRSVGDVL